MLLLVSKLYSTFGCILCSEGKEERRVYTAINRCKKRKHSRINESSKSEDKVWWIIVFLLNYQWQ